MRLFESDYPVTRHHAPEESNPRSKAIFPQCCTKIHRFGIRLGECSAELAAFFRPEESNWLKGLYESNSNI